MKILAGDAEEYADRGGEGETNDSGYAPYGLVPRDEMMPGSRSASSLPPRCRDRENKDFDFVERFNWEGYSALRGDA